MTLVDDAGASVTSTRTMLAADFIAKWRAADLTERAHSGAAHAVEDHETSRQDVGQVLAVRGCLPVLAHRDERHVFPELLLQIGADPLLLLQISGVEPSGAQFLDARTVGPAVYRFLAVGANGQVAVRMNVRQRTIDQGAEHVVAALVRRALIAAAPHNAAEIHFLQIDVHAGAPQLLGTGSRQIAEFVDIGRRHDDNLLALVPGRRQRPLDRAVVARATQHFDADIAGQRRAGAKQTDIVAPIAAISAGDRRHRLGLIDRAEQRSPYSRVG